MQLPVADGDWVAARPLGELRLPEEGITVLGIERAGTWVGAPSLDEQLCAGDVVVLYGREAMLADLAERLHGEEGDVAGEKARAWHAATPPVEQLEPGPRRRAPSHPVG
ncbi:TrkA C-terminal domain-containing protein [Geodermatophilus marinus]|uniref:TrkA C-terminal domain-containing protein n=1 Tax=Geodermatophilus sp. LHW52908 TaxID=2303986 RepID=UPI001314C015|nr:TrkA C-terminal domain-containing protein [Geodermatophilus sp. LHW52908]